MSKTMKKLLSIILAILMVVTTVPLAFAADEESCAVSDCTGAYQNGFCTVCDGYQEPEQNTNGYYEISNAGQLYWFASQVNAGSTAINAVLTQNIDLNPGYIFSSDGTVTKDGAAVTGGWRRWTPIGATYSTRFKGIFDGMFHTVSGMYCNGLSNFGLFAYSGGHITRVGVENGYITGYEYLAGICGSSNGKITKCWNSVTIVGNTEYSSTQNLGGIAGDCTGNIQDCYNIGSISGYRNVGGIVGRFGGNIKPLLSNCYNMGTVSASKEYGSIFGKLSTYYTIENCYYLGETETDSQGGTTVMTAEQFASGAVTYNLNEGVTDGSQTWYQTCGEGYPAFSGKTVYAITEKCYVGTDIIDYTNVPQPKAGHNYQNGICINEREDGTPCGAYEECVQNAEGYYEIVNVGQLYAFAELVNDGETGANAILLADITINQSVLDENGNLQNAASLKKWTPIGNDYDDASYTGTFDGNHKSVSGVYCTDDAAAFIHETNGCKVKDLTIKDSYFSGEQNSAGIVGILRNGSISNCHSVNNVIIAKDYAAGGIVGTARASVIESCSNSSYVKVAGSYSRVGGVVGLLSGTGQVSNCYNTGTIEGPSTIGGIVGTEFENADRTIINCYNIGKIIVNGTEASEYGISGDSQTIITISNCYYLADSETDSHNGTTYMRAENFASGEVAYLLNGSTSEGELAWGQLIGTDSYPVFGGETVYYSETKGYYNILHTCDFSGEWKFDSEKHWKECSEAECEEKSEEATHSYADGVCDNCEYACPHSWGEGVLTRPIRVTTTEWDDGYYTYTCSICGHYYHEAVKRADYSAYDEAIAKVDEYLADETITDEAKAYIVALIKASASEYTDENGYLNRDLIASEQYIVNYGTSEANKLIAGIEEKIASGDIVKADYTEIDKAIAEIEQKFADENVTDEAKAGLEEIKEQLEEMKADENTSVADLAELENALEEYEAELDKGIADGTAVKADYTEIDEAIAEIETALEDATISDEMKAELEDIKSDLEALKGDADATKADVADEIASLIERAEAITETMNACAKGEHSFTTYLEVTAAECNKTGLEKASCDNGCGATDEREVAALEHVFGEYTSNGDATCTADGTKTAECLSGCGAEDTVADEGTKLAHVDEDGDNVCDGCGNDMLCEDCGRPVHAETGIPQYICLIITLIRLIISFIKAVA